MKVAVLSLTRDRLEYTKHCFERLDELAGCDYDHFVLDQNSGDGTKEWLRDVYAPEWVELCDSNIGICRGLNRLLDRVQGYDVVVKFDNDCELLTDNVLRDCARLVHENPGWVVSPLIRGLNEPPAIVDEALVGGVRVLVPSMLGGIFMAANAQVFRVYRHNEGNPLWGMDDVDLTHRTRQAGGQVGYLADHEAFHYETTMGQWARYPEYFARKFAEAA